MASFPNVRHPAKRSAYAECFVVLRRCTLAVAALLHAASRTANALSELATLRGSRVVHATSRFLTRELRAPQFPASLVGTPRRIEVAA
jgi:hypothetical protein